MKRPPIKHKIPKSDGRLPMTKHRRMIERQVKLNLQRKQEHERLIEFYIQRRKDRLDGLFNI